MAKDHLHNDSPELRDPQAAKPEDAVLDEDLGEELSEEELSAAPAVYEEPAEEEEAAEEGLALHKWDKKKKKSGRIPRRLRPLIAAGSILLALLVVYVGVRILFPEVEEVVEEDEGGDYDYLINYMSSDIAAMKFEYEDGYEYEVKLSRSIAESGYTQTSYTVTGKTEFAYDATAFGSLISAACSITSANTAVEAPEDLSVYGLDTPRVRVTYTDLEGVETVILVGDEAPVGTGSYAMLEGGDRVYVMGSYNAQYLLYKDMYYRDRVITSYTTPLEEVDSLRLVTPDGEFHVRRQTEEELAEAGLFACTYQIKAPVDTGANEVYYERYLLSYITAVTALSVVEDRPEDLAQYGLAEGQERAMIELINVDGSTRTIYLGDTAEDGSVYARVRGITSVYQLDGAILGILDATYQDVMDVALWTYMIGTVDNVEMNLDGETHVMDFEHIDEETMLSTLDGEEISDINARMLYTRVLQIYSYDVIKDDAEPGEIVYSFTINFTDGTKATLEFARLTDRTFAVIRNGVELGLYSRVTDFKAIMDGIEDIKIGYTIGRV
ncbi:MAG: DUF4340 domain-containing protein [Ruminococcaceae bacterium]|nr:DUF4340 domain-containing protein [Oscillospiraceae bacterium]